MKIQKKNSLTDIRHEIQRIQLILIIVTTILMSIGGAVVNVNASDKAFDQNLEDTAELVPPEQCETLMRDWKFDADEIFHGNVP